MSRITRDASPPTRANVVAAATGFLAARAPLLERAKNHTRAAGTRPPGTWDMHLHHELRLKHVKYLPGLTNALAALSQARLSSMSLTNPITGEIPTFFSAAERDEEHERLAKHTPIESEAELAGLFNQTIARWCMQTAATLEFKLDTWCPDPPIQWTIRSANSTSYAVADGYLRFASTCPEDMTEEIWNGYQPARDFFPNLAVWEFKSLQVAEDIPAEAILAVSTLPGEFRWQVCPLDETKCLLKHVHNPSVANWAAAHRNGRLTTGARRGPDVPSEILAAQGLGFGPSEPWVNESEVTDCPLETQIGALNIVQQAWSEFVQEDSSFGVIHGGSHEIICFRDRASQTLYLSDIIHPSAQDGYFAIETGLFMAILREIKQRSQLLNQTMWAWTAIYDLQPKHAQGRVPTAPRNRSKKELELNRKAGSPKEEITRPYLTFKIKPTNLKNPQAVLSPYPGPSIENRAFRKIGRAVEDSPVPVTRDKLIEVSINGNDAFTKLDGFDRYRSRGALQAPCDPKDCKVMIKHCRTKDEQEIQAMNQEAENYKALAGTGVPRLIGLCRSDLPEGADYALVLRQVGEPCVVQKLEPRQKREFERILTRIHNLGYIHGNLKLDYLLLDKNKTASICGWKLAGRPGSTLAEKKAKKGDFERLRQLLNPGDIPQLPDPNKERTVHFGPIKKSALGRKSPDKYFEYIGRMARMSACCQGITDIDITTLQNTDMVHMDVKFPSAQAAADFIEQWTSQSPELRSMWGNGLPAEAKLQAS